MPRLIEHYLEWDVLGADSALLTERYQKLFRLWEEGAKQALASYPEVLDSLHKGVPNNWPDDATKRRFALQEKSLTQTSEALRANYDPTIQELVIQGERALRQGIQSTGRAQEDEFQDALRLLKGVLETPIGSRNYAAWFQTGWLQWRAGLISESGESFYQAVRLSTSATEPSAIRYQVLSLLHLAHIESLQKHFDEADQCLERAEKLTPGAPDVLIERARLSVLQGNPSKTPDYLRPAMLKDPSLLYGYFGDEDFTTHIPVVLTRLIQDNTTYSRTESEREIQQYHTLHALVSEALQRLNLPKLSDDFSPDFLNHPEMQGLFGASVLREKAQTKSEELKAESQRALKAEINKSSELMERLQKQLTRFEADRVHWLREKERAELTAKEGSFTLDRYSFKNPLTPRKNQMAEQVRQMHESSISHLKQAEEQIQIMQPDLEAKLDVQMSHIRKVEETIAWLQLEINKNESL